MAFFGVRNYSDPETHAALSFFCTETPDVPALPSCASLFAALAKIFLFSAFGPADPVPVDNFSCVIPLSSTHVAVSSGILSLESGANKTTRALADAFLLFHTVAKESCRLAPPAPISDSNELAISFGIGTAVLFLAFVILAVRYKCQQHSHDVADDYSSADNTN